MKSYSFLFTFVVLTSVVNSTVIASTDDVQHQKKKSSKVTSNRSLALLKGQHKFNRDELKRRNVQFKRAEKEHKNTEEELEKSNKEVERLKIQLQTYQKTEKELEESNQELERLKSQLKTYQKTEKELEESNKEVERLKSEAIQVSTVQEQLWKLMQEKSKLLEKNRNFQVINGELWVSNQSYIGKASEYNTKMKQLCREYKELQENHRIKSECCDQLTADYVKLKQLFVEQSQYVQLLEEDSRVRTVEESCETSVDLSFLTKDDENYMKANSENIPDDKHEAYWSISGNLPRMDNPKDLFEIFEGDVVQDVSLIGYQPARLEDSDGTTEQPAEESSLEEKIQRFIGSNPDMG